MDAQRGLRKNCKAELGLTAESTRREALRAVLA
jgi:hypothetical protein